MDKIMTHKNILKRKVDFQYETIVDIYNTGGCESVREYIDNNDIDEEDYTNFMGEIVFDSSATADELFALMITTKKFGHTTYIECRDSTECPKFMDCIELIGDDKCTELTNYINYAEYLMEYLQYEEVNLFKVTLLNLQIYREKRRDSFIYLVDNFTKKPAYSMNITEEDFKKLLVIISKNVSEDEFQFLLEYLMKELVYAYGGKELSLDNIFKLYKRIYGNYYNIELVKYIHNLYGDKFKISFNIDDDYSYLKKIDKVDEYTDQIYDQMIFNGYEFLSTFASIFYEDLFFPKKDLINHIVDKNTLYKRKIKEGDLDKKDMIFYIEYKKTLSKLVSNINTIKKEIESEKLKYLQDLIADIDIIYDEMMKNYIHRLI
jgi:hypothetical protein